jgi:tetratricopeptide (TPR) repeat protein
VTATPQQFSNRSKGGWGEASSFAQQPDATELEATRAAAAQTYQEGVQLFQKGTAESLQQAITKYEEALPLFRAVGEKAGEVAVLSNIGEVYFALGEKQKALDFYNQSLPLSRAAGDKAAEAVVLNNIGAVYNDLGEKQKALDFFNQSLPLSRAAGDKAGKHVPSTTSVESTTI